MIKFAHNLCVGDIISRGNELYLTLSIKDCSYDDHLEISLLLSRDSKIHTSHYYKNVSFKVL